MIRAIQHWLAEAYCNRCGKPIYRWDRTATQVRAGILHRHCYRAHLYERRQDMVTRMGGPL